MDDKKHNAGLDPMLAGATAALYGLQNQEMVDAHFDEFFDAMRRDFNDAVVTEKMRSLKPRRQMSGGINLPKGDFEMFTFANRIWYTLQRSSTEAYEWYWLKIGVNFRSDMFSPFDFSKVYLARTKGGTLDKIIETVNTDEFKERIRTRLSDWVYNACNDSSLKSL